MPRTDCYLFRHFALIRDGAFYTRGVRDSVSENEDRRCYQAFPSLSPVRGAVSEGRVSAKLNAGIIPPYHP